MKTLKNLVQVASLVLSIVFLASSPIVIFLDKSNSELSKSLLWSAVALLILSRFGDVLELEALGIKARLQEKLEEASATLKQVKTISAAIAKVALRDIATSDLMFEGPDSHYDRLHSRREIKESLESLGLSTEEIHQADKVWFDIVSMLYLMSVLDSFKPHQVEETVEMGGARNAIKEEAKLRSRQHGDPVSYDQLNAFFDRFYVSSEELVEKLDGYKFLVENKNLKNERDYVERSKWGATVLTLKPKG